MRRYDVAALSAVLALLLGCSSAVPAGSPTAVPATAPPSPASATLPPVPTASPAPATPTSQPATPSPPSVDPTTEATPQSTPAEPASASVSIFDFGYDPSTLEIGPGTQVVWRNDGRAPHTVTFDDGPDSGTLQTGESFEFTFEEPGSFDYVCLIHPSMTGTISVSD